jgi:hypothetical protein
MVVPEPNSQWNGCLAFIALKVGFGIRSGSINEPSFLTRNCIFDAEFLFNYKRLNGKIVQYVCELESRTLLDGTITDTAFWRQ